MFFHPSGSVLKSLSSSSKNWLNRQSRDPYVKSRAHFNYRSRSAFKLIEIDDSYDCFLNKPDVRSVVDLGAAPGGWSQVAAERLGLKEAGTGTDWREKSGEQEEDEGLTWSQLKAKVNKESKPDVAQGTPHNQAVIAVDLLPITPITGVHTIQADFLEPSTQSLLEQLLYRNTSPGSNATSKADIILSDISPNKTGNKTADVEASLDVCEAVWKFTKRNLRTAEEIGRKRGGVLVLKHFAHPLLQTFRADCLERGFYAVYFVKPDSSRVESSEGYWVCMGWKGWKEV